MSNTPFLFCVSLIDSLGGDLHPFFFHQLLISLPWLIQIDEGTITFHPQNRIETGISLSGFHVQPDRSKDSHSVEDREVSTAVE